MRIGKFGLSKNIVPVIISFVFLSSCNHSTQPIEKNENNNYGQIVFDFVGAILKPDGTIWTWGHNMSGTLGNGTLNDSDAPVQVLTIQNAVAMDLFAGIAVAADKNGDIWFWGNYQTYLEAPGYDTTVMSPVKISHLNGVKSLSVFALDLYLLRDDGTVWYIRLNHESPTAYIEPVKIDRVENVVQISDMVALKKDGHIITLRSQEYQKTYDSISDAAVISNVYQRRCVFIKPDGTVWAWGKNDFGQLGNGTNVDSEIPTQVHNLSNIVAISANYDYNLALDKNGDVWFWGLEIPSGQNSTGVNHPVKIQNLNAVVLIYADYLSLVMKNDGTYWTFDSQAKTPVRVE